MAWSSSVVTLTDLPMFVPSHLIRDGAPSGPRWNTAGTTAAADTTHVDWPIGFAYDGWCTRGLHTMPDATAATVYAVFQLAAPVDFDTMILCGSNLSDAATITAQIDNAGTFATVTDLHAVAVPAEEQRIVVTKLDHAGGGASRRYSGVNFFRLKFTGTAYQPRLREVWLGRRRQLSYYPNAPWQDRRSVTSAPAQVSESGVVTQTRTSRGAAVRDLDIELTTAAQETDLAAMWAACEYGEQPFWWIETPSSNPQAYLMRAVPAEYNPVLLDGAAHRSLHLHLEEEAPFLALEP
jgi:hypothetical protein